MLLLLTAFFGTTIVTFGIVRAANVSYSKPLFEKWAASESYNFVAYEYRMILVGPFFWGSMTSDIVFRASILDDCYQVRKCWIRFRLKSLFTFLPNKDLSKYDVKIVWDRGDHNLL